MSRSHIMRCLALLVITLSSVFGVPTTRSLASTSPNCNNWGASATGSSLPSGLQIYTPWGAYAGPNGNGQIQIGGYFYGQGDHLPCTEPYSANDYFALDFQLKAGDYVFPHTYGTVIFAGAATRGWSCYGNIVYVQFPSGVSAIYAHLQQAIVSSGQTVTPWTVLGYAGSTGCANGPHLHTALYTNASFQNSNNGIGPYGGSATVPEPIYSYAYGTRWDNLYYGEMLTN